MNFPVSREKYNAAVAERDLLQDQFDAAQKELEEANASLTAAATRESDLSLEVQQLTEKVNPDQLQQIEDLTQQLTDANNSISNLEKDVETRTGELAKANERIAELEQTVKTLKESAVDPSSKAVTDNDATETDPYAEVKFFQENADDVDACVAKLRELGL